MTRVRGGREGDNTLGVMVGNGEHLFLSRVQLPCFFHLKEETVKFVVCIPNTLITDNETDVLTLKNTSCDKDARIVLGNTMTGHPDVSANYAAIGGEYAKADDNKFGKMNFKSLFEPTIEYAENGFPVTETIAYYLDRSKKRFENYPNFRDVWLKNGKMPAKGEIFKNPQLAKTLNMAGFLI